jgi:tetratricopeptide (TPR) repeat protein
MESRQMPRLFKQQLAGGIALVAGALLVTSAAPAEAQQTVGGRMRVLVPPFASSTGGVSKVGEKIADRLKKQVDELPTHAPADDKEVKKQLDKYKLNPKEMTCVQWRQLMQYVNAELTLCGEVDETTKSVKATFYSAKNTSFEVPQFTLQSEDQAAQQVVQSFRTYARQLELVVFCSDYVQSQNWQAALDNCNQAVELNPRSVDAHYLRGSALTNMDKSEEALAAYQKVLELDPMHPDAMLAAGITASKLNRQDLAQKYFREYLALNPGSVEVRLKIATDLMKNGDPEGALRLMQEVATDTAAYAMHEYAGHFAISAAVKKMQEKPAADPEAVSPEALELFRTAIKHYEIVLRKAEKVDPQVQHRLILAYTNVGETPKAIAAAERATAATPDNADIWFAYAETLHKAGRIDDAMKALDRVAQINPQYANVKRLRALMLLEQGRPQEAVNAVKAAAASGEIDQSVVENVSQQMSSAGFTQVKAGRHEQAASYFRAAREIGKSDRSIGMANFFEGYSLILQADPIIRKGNNAAAARRALPLFRRAKTLLEGAGGVPEQASQRASLLQQVSQFIEVGEALIKRGG